MADTVTFWLSRDVTDVLPVTVTYNGKSVTARLGTTTNGNQLYLPDNTARSPHRHTLAAEPGTDVHPQQDNNTRNMTEVQKAPSSVLQMFCENVGWVFVAPWWANVVRPWRACPSLGQDVSLPLRIDGHGDRPIPHLLLRRHHQEVEAVGKKKHDGSSVPHHSPPFQSRLQENNA
ncbi:hypothetical protein E2C01_033571 [Portunus trituberculatus]|uniref:Uncharacterized protein n=1 Tax=Portunus trituberculatus TaxID=210409 RepID=A0A5B7F3S7_PORTR|nr:hypothetical protein [Portunus trituberculatus]